MTATGELDAGALQTERNGRMDEGLETRLAMPSHSMSGSIERNERKREVKLTKEAQELVATTLTTKGVRADAGELVTIFRQVESLAIQRQESMIGKGTMADALDMNHYLDARILGIADAVAWAKEAAKTHSAMFGIECFTRIHEGLAATKMIGKFANGWREGIGNYVADLKRGDAT